MAIPPPPVIEPVNPLLLVASDLRRQRHSQVPFPAGEHDFSLARTMRFSQDPLPILLHAYERFGPVFTLRVFHALLVFAIGPEANHYITVSHADNFTWRESHFRDLTALIGDGLLTTDGEFHRRSRQIMLPAFHHESIAAAASVIARETQSALEQLNVGEEIDLYRWARRLTLDVALKALFGLDPHGGRARELDAAGLFVQALSFYATPYPLRMLRGPRTPWSRLIDASKRLNKMIYAEIKQRRASGQRGQDILSLLLDAKDEDGEVLSDAQIRDEVMTLLFAGHDTTTSTVAFLFYELARHQDIVADLVAELDDVFHNPTDHNQTHGSEAAASPMLDAQLLSGGGLPQLELVLAETLRKYPPAWIGPRRSVQPFELHGVKVPGETYVNYSSWASHHLQDVFADPSEFRPQRFAPAAKSKLPKGAYIPFGGGSRICIGMRFGQLEARVIATSILQRFSFRLRDGFQLSMRQMPTLSPRHGLPIVIEDRAPISRKANPKAREPRPANATSPSR